MFWAMCGLWFCGTGEEEFGIWIAIGGRMLGLGCVGFKGTCGET